MNGRRSRISRSSVARACWALAWFGGMVILDLIGLLWEKITGEPMDTVPSVRTPTVRVAKYARSQFAAQRRRRWAGR